MNKYSIKEFLEEKLKSYSSTLHNTSYDSENNQHLCLDTTLSPVYDFDGFVKDHFPLHQLPASPDAIYIANKKLYFVEFKNQNANTINSSDIKNKFRSGTAILKDLLRDFLPKDIVFVFCVVHKNGAQRTGFNANHFMSTQTRFNLEEVNKEENEFYDHIITESVDFYKDSFDMLQC